MIEGSPRPTNQPPPEGIGTPAEKPELHVPEGEVCRDQVTYRRPSKDPTKLPIEEAIRPPTLKGDEQTPGPSHETDRDHAIFHDLVFDDAIIDDEILRGVEGVDR